MALWNEYTLTSAGKKLIGDAVAGEKTVKFVSVVLGSGTPTDTALGEQQQEFEFASVSHAGDNTVTLQANVTNAGLESGYTISEMGVYAKLEDDTENTLIMTSTAKETDFMPPIGTNTAVDTTMTIKMYLPDTATSEIYVDLESYASKSYVKEQLAALLDTVHPVGEYWHTSSDKTPTEIFGIGEWEEVQDRMLIGAGGSYKQGTTGGSKTVTLTTSNLPSHTHSASSSSSGAHTHTRGSMEISGGPIYTHVQTLGGNYGSLGAFKTWNGGYSAVNEGSSNSALVFDFAASRNWSGSTSSNGSHSHSITVNATGSGEAVETISPYLAVYIWHRVA